MDSSQQRRKNVFKGLPVEVTQINSINIFEPPPNTLPSGLLYNPSNDSIDHHQQQIPRLIHPPLGRNHKSVSKEERVHRKEGGKVGKIDEEDHNLGLAPPSIEYIVIENQLSERQHLLNSNKLRIQDIFDNKQRVSSKIFSTQKLTRQTSHPQKEKTSIKFVKESEQMKQSTPPVVSLQAGKESQGRMTGLGREGSQKQTLGRERKDFIDRRSSSIEIEDQYQQSQERIAQLRKYNNKMDNILVAFANYKPNTSLQDYLRANNIDSQCVKTLLEQFLRKRGVAITK